MKNANFAGSADRRTARVVLFAFVLVVLLLMPGPASAQDKAGRDSLFDAKLFYSAWDLGTSSGYINGWDGELCPRWWPWPWPWPWPPKWDFRISSYDIDEDGLTRATPLEFGLLIPISRSSRVTPFVGIGIGYYLFGGDSSDIGDEFGAYGALGADVHLGEHWGLSIEAAYREVGGDLDLGGPAFKAGLGISF